MTSLKVASALLMSALVAQAEVANNCFTNTEIINKNEELELQSDSIMLKELTSEHKVIEVGGCSKGEFFYSVYTKWGIFEEGVTKSVITTTLHAQSATDKLIADGSKDFTCSSLTLDKGEEIKLLQISPNASGSNITKLTIMKDGGKSVTIGPGAE